MDFLKPYSTVRPSSTIKAKSKNRPSKLSLKDRQKSAQSYKENISQALPSSKVHPQKTADLCSGVDLFGSLISSDESDHEDKLLSDSTFFEKFNVPKAESTRLEIDLRQSNEQSHPASFFSCKSQLTTPSGSSTDSRELEGACEDSVIYFSDDEGLPLSKVDVDPKTVIPESTESDSTDEKAKHAESNNETIILDSSSEDDSFLRRKHFVGKAVLAALNSQSQNKQDQWRNIVIPTSSSCSDESNDIIDCSLHAPGFVSKEGKNVNTPASRKSSFKKKSYPPIRRRLLESSEDEAFAQEQEELSPRTLAAEKLSDTKVNDIQRWINGNDSAVSENCETDNKNGKSSKTLIKSQQKEQEDAESSSDDSIDVLIRRVRKPPKMSVAKSSFIVDDSSSSSGSFSHYRKFLTDDIKKDINNVNRTPFGVITGKPTPRVRGRHDLQRDLSLDSSTESESNAESSSGSDWDPDFSKDKKRRPQSSKNPVDEKITPKPIRPILESRKAGLHLDTWMPTKKPVDDIPRTIKKPVDDTPRAFKKPVDDTPRAFKKPVDDTPRTFKKLVDDTPRTFKKPVDDTPRTFKKPVDDTPRTLKKPVDDTPRTLKKPVDDTPRTLKKPMDDTPRTLKKTVGGTPRTLKKPVDDTPRPLKKPVDDKPRSLKKLSEDKLSTPLVTPRTGSKYDKVEELKKASTPYSPIRTFLTSLSGPLKNENLRNHPEASLYVKNYKSKKEELARRLFKLFNREVFDSRLPDDLALEWSGRMLSTAGYCSCKLIRRPQEVTRTAKIVLSSKILDSADRLRDTLIHELCHAAVWLLNQISGGHGPFWKAWAAKATRRFPELPQITVCHAYDVETKFTYKCTKCGYNFGRHSKSINLQTQRCGHCFGTFELFVNKGRNQDGSAVATPATPKPPTGFALFVKENYGSVKKEHADKKHGDIMKLLGQKFAEVKIGQ